VDADVLFIYELKYKLLRGGFSGSQVDAIVLGVIGSQLPEEADPASRKRLIDELEYYLVSAAKYVNN
jgi:hypothetical protein